jgi:periplasmic divalent cation tolerance protein
MIFVYLTCKNAAEAKKLAKTAIKKQLAICGNIFPITSVYPWKGKIKEHKESVLILKTFQKHYLHLRQELKNTHSYETPFIGKFEIDTNKEYDAWAHLELR